MRSSKDSVILLLYVNEDKEEVSFNYSGRIDKLINTLVMATVQIIKSKVIKPDTTKEYKERLCNNIKNIILEKL